MALYYFMVGLIFCITIIGIPFGMQLLKLGVFALWPFGSQIVPGKNDGGCLSVLMNIIWLLVGGVEIAMLHVSFGLACFITIIGIPFGVQHFKMAVLALLPFGKEIV